MQRIENDSAYFLHQMPYRDNSAIVELLTRENGKVSFIVSGLKAKRHAKRPYLQPCHLLTIDYQLKPSLSKLIGIDFANTAPTSNTLPRIADFMLYQYAHELLLTILPAQLPVPTVFDDYQRFLTLLVNQQPHTALRHIEIALILSFSGLPTLDKTEDTQNPPESDKLYWFYPEHGLFSRPRVDAKNGIQVDGAQVQALHYLTHYDDAPANSPLNETIAQGAKSLTTSLINQLLNGKPLKTRQVYRALNAYL